MSLTPAATDKFLKVGNPGTATTLSAPGYTNGVSASINVGSTTNWPPDTLTAFAIDRAEIVNGVEQRVAGTYCEFVGIVSSPTAIGSVSKTFGTGQDYPAGSLTRVYIPVTGTQNDYMVDGLNVDHDGAGHHKTLHDTNGNEMLEFGVTASAVNQLKATNAATGTNPLLQATGDDTNVGFDISSKGTGGITMWAGAKARELLKLLNVASAINQLKISPSATGNPVLIEGDGDDTNVGITITPKGTGPLLLNNVKNPYKFSAHLAADQNGISDATFTKVAFDTEDFDTNNNFDVTTNKGRYTAPVAGFYQVNAFALMLPNGGSVGATGIVSLYKNGSEIKRNDIGTPSSGNTSAALSGSFSELVQLAASDYLEIFVYCDVTASNSRVIGDAIHSRFSGFLVSAL